MGKWLRTGNTLVDLSQYSVFYAKENEWKKGPECESWCVWARTAEHERILLRYVSSKKEANEFLDVIYRALT